MTDAKGLSEVQGRHPFEFEGHVLVVPHDDYAALAERLKATERERDLQCTMKHNLMNRL